MRFYKLYACIVQWENEFEKHSYPTNQWLEEWVLIHVHSIEEEMEAVQGKGASSESQSKAVWCSWDRLTSSDWQTAALSSLDGEGGVVELTHAVRPLNRDSVESRVIFQFQGHSLTFTTFYEFRKTAGHDLDRSRSIASGCERASS